MVLGWKEKYLIQDQDHTGEPSSGRCQMSFQPITLPAWLSVQYLMWLPGHIYSGHSFGARPTYSFIIKRSRIISVHLSILRFINCSFHACWTSCPVLVIHWRTRSSLSLEGAQIERKREPYSLSISFSLPKTLALQSSHWCPDAQSCWVSKLLADNKNPIFHSTQTDLYTFGNWN